MAQGHLFASIATYPEGDSCEDALRRLSLSLVVLLACMTPLRADPAAGPVRVAATQSALGDIAVQIGGSDVSLRPLSAATLSGDAADLVLVEGGPTDSWARALLQRLPRHIAVLRSTDASDPSPGFSWYDISGMRRLSGEIAAALIRQRPSEAQAIGDRLSRFEAALDGLDRQASELAAYYRVAEPEE